MCVTAFRAPLSGRLLVHCAITLCLIFALAPCVAAAAANDLEAADLQAALRQFREFYLETTGAYEMRDTNEPAPDPDLARSYAQSQRPDGSWADVNYADLSYSAWQPSIHYQRLTALATVAMRQGLPPEERTALLAATHRAFAFWIAHDFQCPNWWYRYIGTPKLIGTAALLLGDQLTKPEYDYVTGTLLPRATQIEKVGQNRVWLSGNTLMCGLLKGDAAMVAGAADAIWSEVAVTTGEGIQPDSSFHQHGAQQQFGNYGMAFAVEISRWGRILRATHWQLPVDRLGIFRRYLLDGQAWVSWRGALDISACGRQLMPHSPVRKTANLMRVMEQAQLFDAEGAAGYRAYLARNQPGAANDLTGNRYFWRSDYLIHRRPDFSATLKLSSRRVIGAELVNHENLSGYHTADGALYLYRTGDEYEDIFPVWDWARLPGVTCAHSEPPPYETSFIDRDFVGGISDGADGLAVLDYLRDGVHAKKAWFFSGDTIVCLGAGITGDSNSGIATTLNQCLLRGAVTAQSDGKTVTVITGAPMPADTESVEHDGWRYTLLEGGNLRLATGPVTGNWSCVFRNPDTPPADVTRNLFTLWLDHGQSVHDAHYAYAIAPAAAPLHSHVIANSAALQAVRLASGKFGVVFWAPGKIQLPGSHLIAVKQPCLLLVSSGAVQVVDPTQKLALVNVVVDGHAHTVTLPQGEFAGTAARIE